MSATSQEAALTRRPTAWRKWLLCVSLVLDTGEFETGRLYQIRVGDEDAVARCLGIDSSAYIFETADGTRIRADRDGENFRYAPPGEPFGVLHGFPACVPWYFKRKCPKRWILKPLPL